MPYKKLFQSVKKQYLGKPVAPKYRSKYGKRYDLSEVKSVAFAIENKLKMGKRRKKKR